MDAMLFEHCLCIILGQKAYQTASLEDNVNEKTKLIVKAIQRLEKDVNRLDTTLRHKGRLLDHLSEIKLEIKKKCPTWGIIYNFLYLTALFLGYDYLNGEKCYETIYYQDLFQYIKTNSIKYLEIKEIQNNAIIKRKEIAYNLKNEGLDTFKISLILNISEYEVKKLLKD